MIVDLVGQPAPQQTKHRIHRGEQQEHEAHLPACQRKLTVRSSSSDTLVVGRLFVSCLLLLSGDDNALLSKKVGDVAKALI